MTTRITKDSGERQEFVTGARRDNGGHKPTPLIRWDVRGVAYVYNFHFDRSEPLYVLPSMLKDPAFGLIPPLMLNRLQALFERGAEKYGGNNWQLGIPLQRIYESLMRHLLEAWAGDTTEDHLAAIIWNATAIMIIEAKIVSGDLPEWLGDAGALLHGEHTLAEIRASEEAADTGHDTNVRNGGT